jgi:hypothetical protein
MDSLFISYPLFKTLKFNQSILPCGDISNNNNLLSQILFIKTSGIAAEPADSAPASPALATGL